MYLGKPISPCVTEYTSRRTGNKYHITAENDGTLTVKGVDRALLIMGERSRDAALSLLDIADRNTG